MNDWCFINIDLLYCLLALWSKKTFQSYLTHFKKSFTHQYIKDKCDYFLKRITKIKVETSLMFANKAIYSIIWYVFTNQGTIRYNKPMRIILVCACRHNDNSNQGLPKKLPEQTICETLELVQSTNTKNCGSRQSVRRLSWVACFASSSVSMMQYIAPARSYGAVELINFD